MSNWPILSRAPIVEGLIDIRVERSDAVTLVQLKHVGDELAEAFPSRQERRMWMGQINLSATAPTSISTKVDEPDGFILRSADEKWVAQFRLDGFTISRLQPYGTWSELKSKATELWGRYRSAAQPNKIVRVASRFINRVQIPLGESFEKTFATTFSLAPSLPQSVAGYLLRVVIPFEAEQATAILTQSLEANSTDCVFDLDAFSERSEGFTEEEAWAQLDILREVKDKLFFGSLTPSALENFK